MLHISLSLFSHTLPKFICTEKCKCMTQASLSLVLYVHVFMCFMFLIATSFESEPKKKELLHLRYSLNALHLLLLKCIWSQSSYDMGSYNMCHVNYFLYFSTSVKKQENQYLNLNLSLNLFGVCKQVFKTIKYFKAATSWKGLQAKDRKEIPAQQ